MSHPTDNPDDPIAGYFIPEPGSIDWDTPAEDMAPHDLRWHRQYSKTFALMTMWFNELMEHPAFKEAQEQGDLGDYVETIATLITFRPHTREDIEKNVYVELYGEDTVAEALSKYPPDNEEEK